MIIRALGREPSQNDERTLSFSRYVGADIPPAPPLVDWSRGVQPISNYRNDTLGICAFASAAHTIRAWNVNNGRDVSPSQDDVERAYSDVGKYVPADPSTWNNGASMLDVAKYWRNEGIGGHKIRAFLRVNAKDPQQLRIASWLFGPLYCGASLPLRAKMQARWSVPLIRDASDRVGGWGGHAMACPRFDRSGVTFFTWGDRQDWEWDWWLEYVDEVYCALADDWIGSLLAVAPNHFDFATLARDLNAIAALA